MRTYKNRKYIIIFLRTKQIPYISEQDILLIIKSLDSTKAHGCDNLSTKRMKICSESITILLKIIFEQSLERKTSRNLVKSNSCTFSRSQKPREELRSDKLPSSF